MLFQGRQLWISTTVAASNFERSPRTNASLLRLSLGPQFPTQSVLVSVLRWKEIPNEQAGGLNCSSSMMSIESLVWKVSNIYHSLCLIQINLINLACMYSRQENETQTTTSMSLSPRTCKDKLVTLVTATTSAAMGITKL